MLHDYGKNRDGVHSYGVRFSDRGHTGVGAGHRISARGRRRTARSTPNTRTGTRCGPRSSKRPTRCCAAATDGYAGIEGGRAADITEEDLRPRFRPGGFGHQPARFVDETQPLHPMLLDTETLHQRFPGPDGSAQEATNSPPYSTPYTATGKTNTTTNYRQGGPRVNRSGTNCSPPIARTRRRRRKPISTGWTRTRRQAGRFRELRRPPLHPRGTPDVGGADRGPQAIPDRRRELATAAPDTTIADAVANRIDYAIARGDTVTIGTRSFGDDTDNTELVPGLIGDHAYSVVGIERSDAGTKLVLDNPHGAPPSDENGTPVVPAPGIEYGDRASSKSTSPTSTNSTNWYSTAPARTASTDPTPTPRPHRMP